MNSPLRDQRYGRLLAARGGKRIIVQGERGGTQLDNITRIADWRNRYSLVPIEMTVKQK